jgi:hypothetical protein
MPMMTSDAKPLPLSPSPQIAGATSVTATVVFIPSNAWPATGTLQLQFPSGFSIPASPTITLSGDTGTATSSGQLVTVTRSGSGSSVSGGATVTLTIAGLTNPTVSGSTAAFPLIRTLTSADLTIDEAGSAYNSANRPAAVTLNPGVFLGTPTVSLGSVVAGATSVTAYVNMTISNPLPATGSIVLEFPSGFTVPSGACPEVV